ncbi:glycosyltransferase [Tannockella kyphosi]|uniref:glycosyltransferase n=1 Tax=Tannockella kyphosi TaxID=2899121 RepID=UPI002011D303|nr:glycosyltransferase [Tannockella kyphosi]
MELFYHYFFCFGLWLIVPFLFELLPAILCYLFLNKNKKPKIDIPPKMFPEITILIPVYNCQETLERCIASINDCSYENYLISILLLDTGCTDDTFDVFQLCQLKYDINMRWISSNLGKAKALNKGLFNSEGKYIVNVDTIGYFHVDSLCNIVTRFENDRSIDCLTGVVLTDKKQIKKKSSIVLRFIRRFEFLDFCKTFFTGKNYKSNIKNQMTVSAPYTVFKKSSILSTFLYDTNTLVEDSHITAQLSAKNFKVSLCENAIFYIPPTHSIRQCVYNKRQWNMDQLKIFSFQLIKKSILSSLVMYLGYMIKAIWFVSMTIYTYSIFGFYQLGISFACIYGIYLISTLFYSFNILSYLSLFCDDKKYYLHSFIFLLLHPIYKVLTYPYQFILTKKTSHLRYKNNSSYTIKDEISMFFCYVWKDITFSWLKKEEK